MSILKCQIADCDQIHCAGCGCHLETQAGGDQYCNWCMEFPKEQRRPDPLLSFSSEVERLGYETNARVGGGIEIIRMDDEEAKEG